jgi:hypothetical protein
MLLRSGTTLSHAVNLQVLDLFSSLSRSTENAGDRLSLQSDRLSGYLEDNRCQLLFGVTTGTRTGQKTINAVHDETVVRRICGNSEIAPVTRNVVAGLL